jgi:hypothetical protein
VGVFYMRGAAGILERPVDVLSTDDVVAVPDLDQERHVRQRHAQWLGALSMEQTVDAAALTPETDQQPAEQSLAKLIEQAREGNAEALAAVRMNAHTTVIETLLKTGNIMRIAAELDEQGNLKQHSHTYDSIHRNAWHAVKHQSAHARWCSETEALNWQRTEESIKNGKLADNWFVVFSSASESQSIADLKKRGYFVHTMTSVFQATTVEHGKVATESAFVAGMEAVSEDPVQSNEANNAKIAAAARNRYDLDVIRKLYMDFGVAGADLMNAEDLLATPLLIPKKLMPHGIASIVELYDSYAGGTFFGVQQPKQVYETYADVCAKRAEKYGDITDLVVADLLKLRAASPAQAITKLYKLVKYHTFERALRDDSIDASVFGAKAEKIVYQARQAFDDGDQMRFMLLAVAGHEVAVTTACGGGAGGSEDTNSSTDKGLEKGEQADKFGGIELNEKSTWTWKKGVCRVESCPTRPGKTKVGPCDVCSRCQHIFDKGIDPTKYKSSKAKQRQGIGEAAINDFKLIETFSFKPTVTVYEKQPAKEKLALAA